MPQPNVIIAFGDQWRAQAVGYAGNPNVLTPNLDALAEESVSFSSAVAGCPVCSPYRASLLTGQYPLTHGVFLNDAYLSSEPVSLAEAFRRAGYDTAYIGKWHVDGHGRTNYTPPERRQGFRYWKALECTHDYNHSLYYGGDSDTRRFWKGYDALAQTQDACRYLREREREKPFLLVLSWGPPHNPYETAPAEYRALYDPEKLILRPNVPEAIAPAVRRWLAGYYAHCTALDSCVGMLLDALRQGGLQEETIFLFTSDHGDMLGSHGLERKQKPWDESVRVPFLLRYPAGLGREAWELPHLIDAQDVMPTLLGLCELPIPPSVQGRDLSGSLLGREGVDSGQDDAAVLACYHPFGEWFAGGGGPPAFSGREYRGLRTRRYTYVRSLQGPWLLYDNQVDPYQMENLIGRPDAADLQATLDRRLTQMLRARGDGFCPGLDYVWRWGYRVDDTGTLPTW